MGWPRPTGDGRTTSRAGIGLVVFSMAPVRMLGRGLDDRPGGPVDRGFPGEDGPMGRDTRKAMTLIEMLVVVAVVGLLLALIVPALHAARAAARRADCVQNL